VQQPNWKERKKKKLILLQIISLKQEETRRSGALIALTLFYSYNAGNTAEERSAMLSASSSHSFTLFRTRCCMQQAN